MPYLQRDPMKPVKLLLVCRRLAAIKSEPFHANPASSCCFLIIGRVYELRQCREVPLTVLVQADNCICISYVQYGQGSMPQDLLEF